MLDPDIREDIETHALQFPMRSAACIDALRIVQEHYRWISDDHLKEVAELLSMSPEEVEGVATFYNLLYRRPVGQHVVLVCDSVTCWMMGGGRVRRRLEERLGVRLGETTADDRFTLLPIVCLGDCDHAPVLMVGEDLHHDLDEDGVDAVLARYREEP